ncbi:sensor histidine kinase [Vagococcus humatus]|uniref:histidine kinase n=1 Tax=Vagococcus humatus TaxID=1889241 RepID=A0A3S0GCK9_9ENTE|nr:sensor histidine kinase [Vagococcus humatus]RST88739.1 two-component sensor histidine kinase [Vagococcus humatus]
MKYLFQQMIAFWTIILTILVIVGVSFTQFTKQTVLSSTYTQLTGYAENIVTDIQTEPERLLSDIRATETVLQKQNVNLFLLNMHQRIEFPEEIRGSSAQFIPKKSWNEAIRGQVVQNRLDVELSKKKTQVAVILYPVVIGSDPLGVLAVVQPLSTLERSLQMLTDNLFKGFLISSIIALVFSYFIAKFQVNRINRMKKATKEISQGNFDVKIQINGTDELDELAGDFNKMTQALKESQEEIERQEDRRRQFMADVAHEMRTPLTTINGLLEGIAYHAIPPEQEEKCISLMRNETNRLIRLVNENLDYEKIRSNQIHLAIQKIDATKTLQNIVIQLEGKAQTSQNELVFTGDEGIFVYADYDRFVQVAMNIIQNAIQFTENGRIEVSVYEAAEGITMKISDTGIGMSEEEVRNIWERYYKVDPSRKNTKYGESGLGLPIVQEIIRLHHGKIEVDSQQGVGTTFYVTYPKQEKE